MNGKRTESDKWLERIGLLIVAPVLVVLGTTAVFMLATPILLALPVIAATIALLWLATAVTRQSTVAEQAIEEDPMCETVDLIATLEPETVEPETVEPETVEPETVEPETVEMVDELVDAPNSPVNVSIIKVFGPCPLGMMPGNTWKIGPDGKLSRPMCRPGATALSALFLMANGDATDRSACCECVIAGREVTFAVREPV